MSTARVGLPTLASITLTKQLTSGGVLATQSVPSQDFSTSYPLRQNSTAPAFDAWEMQPQGANANATGAGNNTPAATSSMFDWDKSNPSRILTKMPGWYYATAQVEFAPSTIGQRSLWIESPLFGNGATVATVDADDVGTAYPLALTVTTPIQYCTGSASVPAAWVMRVAQNSGSALNINIHGVSNPTTLYFHVVFLGVR